MRRKFWQWAHDSVEKLWHWIYYAKLAPKRELRRGIYRYNVQYFNSQTGELSAISGLSEEKKD